MEVFGVPKKIEDLTQGSHTKKKSLFLKEKACCWFGKSITKIKSALIMQWYFVFLFMLFNAHKYQICPQYSLLWKILEKILISEAKFK